MSSFPCTRSLRAIGLAAFVLLSGKIAFAGTTVIGTTNFAYSGSNSGRTYSVPSGANCVTIQAWGTQGYVDASYLASPGNNFTVTLNKTSGTTTVATTNGTISISGSTATAGGSSYAVTTDSNYTNGSGPASPGAANSYVGYVNIVASNTTYSLTITGSPSAGGTFTGAGSYPPLTQVNIGETASNGYTTAGWTGPDAGSVASPTSASSTIIMSANRTLVANFDGKVPSFTSSNANQVLLVGRSYSYQVAATNSPVYSATGLPPGIVISSTGALNGTPTAAGTYSATITASNNAVSVIEESVGAGQTCTISSSTLGNNLNVYATDLNLEVNGTASIGFCIDPWDSSVEGQPLAYNWETLAAGPKVADGMGTSVAMEIGQLWDQYYSPTISNNTAAGLQIAIWELVAGSIGAQNLGNYSFALDSSNNYGASSMIQWVLANPSAPVAALDALTGNGQDYVTSASNVPQSSIATATQVIPFTVYATPVVASKTASIPINQPYSYTISATNNPTSFNASTLPPGMTVNTATGVVSGTPTTTGTYSGNISATNPGATGTGSLSLTVVPTYTLTINGAPVAGGTTTGAGAYVAGTVVTITETPTAGYRTNGWGGTDVGSVASPSSASTTIVMNANRSLTANFVQQFTLTVTAGPGGTATSGGVYDAGTTVPISESASGGYRTNGWSGSGVGSVASPTSASTTIVMSANEAITANFMQRVTLSITTNTGGTATGGGTYDLGTVVPITETANTGYRTNGWTGAGVGNVGSPSNASTSIVMSANESITATFMQRVTLTVTAGTGGTATGSGTYDLGATVPITETANTGYRTSAWTGSGVGSVASPSSASTSIVMNSNEAVTAGFVQQFTLSVVGATGGTVTGGGTYDAGTSAPITETASTGYRTNGWTGGGGAVASPSSASTTVLMNANQTVDASFVQRVTLTVVGATGGTVTGGGTFDVGTSAPITETANTGYRTNGWTGGGGAVASPSSASTTVLMNANQTVDASFVQRVTLTVVGATGGTVTGGGTFDLGAVAPITETANAGYRTNGWTGSVGAVSSPSSASTTVTMSGNETVDASFIQQVTLTVVGGAGGTVTGGGTFDLGTSAPITETANTGYRASGWGGPGLANVTSPNNAATTIVMNGNETIDANFIQQVTLTVVAGAGGTATGGGTYDLGSVVPITATPSTGYAFTDWTGTSPSSPLAPATVITLNGNDTVDANFAPQPPTVALTAAATAFTGSPFHVTSAAAAPADDLTLHSVEWLSPAGVWTVDSIVASGATDNMAVGINFATTGVWTLRAGASIDGGVTWVYSPNTQVTVSSGISNYTLETMAVPSASSLLWYAPSPVAQKTYQVQHVNP